jgi:uncharacterized membrane protein
MMTTQEANKILRRNRRTIVMCRVGIVLMYALKVMSFVISVLFWVVTIVLMASALNSRSRRSR